MAKKQVIENTKALLIKYLETNQFGIFNEAFMSTRPAIRKLKPKENSSSVYIDNYLEYNLSDISNKNTYFPFLKHLLSSNHKEEALYQAIKKTPSSKNYEYDTCVKDLVSILSPYKQVLFDYVARPKFLEASYDRLPDIFKVLDSQEQREAIFELIFKTKTFTSVDTQVRIYQWAQEYLKRPQKYEDNFNRIQKLTPDENLVESRINVAITLNYDVDKLSSVDVENKSISGASIDNNIHSHAKEIFKKLKTELQITDVICQQTLQNKGTINILCDSSTAELNKTIFSELINKIAHFNSYEEINEYFEDIEHFVKEAKTKFWSDTLQQDLKVNDSNSKKLKI